MPPFPEARFIETNGIRMAVYEQGEEGGGPPVVLCHGWPELAYSWRRQISALAGAGYRVIAPDMRGYGRTERPEAIGDYDIHHLTGDMAGLLDALGIERAVFCGHDWGGIVTWAMPLLQPERVLGVIGVNTPFMPRPPIEPLGFMRQAFGEEMYMVVFQQPGRAEAILEADVEKSLRFLFRKVRLPAELLDSTEGRKQTLAWIGALAALEGMPEGELVMDEAALAVYREAFAATGFTGGLNWYRNLTRNWESTEGLEQRIDAPCLMIAAADDFVLRPSMTDGMERYIPDLEKYVIEDCGHWTQMEQPETLNRLMLDWLGRRFGSEG